jgi:Flp pilus assembly protein TadD
MLYLPPKRGALLLLFILAACNGGAGPIDGQKFLSGLSGPKVPSVQDTLVETAKNAEKMGDYAQATALYQQLLEKSPDNTEIALMLADALRKKGDYTRAIAIYDSLLKQDDKLIAAKEGKALALMATGDFETPTKLFEEVMAADSKRWKTLNGLGILFTTRGMHVEAQQYFDEALKHNPSSASIMNNMGLSQALDKQYESAITSLTEAASLTDRDSPERKRIEMNTALVYAIMDKFDEARAIAERYYSGHELNNNLGLYAHLGNNDQMAKAYLNMALTNSKVFYEKAWNNLQAIGTGKDSPY